MLFHTLYALPGHITGLVACLCVIGLAGCGPAADVPDDGKLEKSLSLSTPQRIYPGRRRR